MITVIHWLMGKYYKIFTKQFAINMCIFSLYEDVGTLLDQKFRCAYNLTYFTMAGVKNVDTSKFRRAIWNYIQCIYGIRHDDYDYGEVNQVSEINYVEYNIWNNNANNFLVRDFLLCTFS